MPRSLAALAQEALAVQDACNLSGVVHGWHYAVTNLREALPAAGTEELNRHPINVMWASKVASLTGCDVMTNLSRAMDACQQFIDDDKKWQDEIVNGGKEAE